MYPPLLPRASFGTTSTGSRPSPRKRRLLAEKLELHVDPASRAQIRGRGRLGAVKELPVAESLVERVVLDGVGQSRLVEAEVDRLRLTVGLHPEVDVREGAFAGGPQVEFDGAIREIDITAEGHGGGEAQSLPPTQCLHPRFRVARLPAAVGEREFSRDRGRESEHENEK